MTTTTDYDKQATDFLEKHHIKFMARRVAKQTCPIWDDEKHRHGYKYRVWLLRTAGVGWLDRTWFYFWNSFVDRENGKEPRPYDVLASIASDVNCPDTFKDFCSEYGYDLDSRKAEATFKACQKHSKRLRSFFTEKEIEDLREIQ